MPGSAAESFRKLLRTGRVIAGQVNYCVRLELGDPLAECSGLFFRYAIDLKGLD
jgi:hypothetical protein